MLSVQKGLDCCRHASRQVGCRRHSFYTMPISGKDVCRCSSEGLALLLGASAAVIRCAGYCVGRAVGAAMSTPPLLLMLCCTTRQVCLDLPAPHSLVLLLCTDPLTVPLWVMPHLLATPVLLTPHHLQLGLYAGYCLVRRLRPAAVWVTWHKPIAA
jgi:hypothetical protein